MMGCGRRTTRDRRHAVRRGLSVYCPRETMKICGAGDMVGAGPRSRTNGKRAHINPRIHQTFSSSGDNGTFESHGMPKHDCLSGQFWHSSIDEHRKPGSFLVTKCPIAKRLNNADARYFLARSRQSRRFPPFFCEKIFERMDGLPEVVFHRAGTRCGHERNELFKCSIGKYSLTAIAGVLYQRFELFRIITPGNVCKHFRVISHCSSLCLYRVPRVQSDRGVGRVSIFLESALRGGELVLREELVPLRILDDHCLNGKIEPPSLVKMCIAI